MAGEKPVFRNVRRSTLAIGMQLLNTPYLVILLLTVCLILSGLKAGRRDRYKDKGAIMDLVYLPV